MNPQRRLQIKRRNARRHKLRSMLWERRRVVFTIGEQDRTVRSSKRWRFYGGIIGTYRPRSYADGLSEHMALVTWPKYPRATP